MMQSTIHEKFLDVEFHGREACGRSPGCLPRDDEPGATLPIYEEVHADELIPEHEWQDRIEAFQPMEPLLQEIKDQRREGTCTSNQESQKFEVVFYRQHGVWIQTSAISLYRQVARGPRAGSSLPANAEAIGTTGILPTDTRQNRETCKRLGIPAEHFHPDRGYYTEPKPGWRKTAALFRADERCDFLSFEGLMTNLFLHHPPGYARDGHSILGMCPMWERKRGYVVKYANSYQPEWGDAGYGYDSRGVVERGIRQYRGGTVTRSVLTPTGLVSLE